MILHTLKGYKTIGQRQCLAPFDNTHFYILFAHHYRNLCRATVMISLFFASNGAKPKYSTKKRPRNQMHSCNLTPKS